MIFENGVLLVNVESRSMGDVLKLLEQAVRVPMMTTFDLDLERQVTMRFREKGMREGIERALSEIGALNYWVDGQGDFIARVLISPACESDCPESGPWVPTPFPDERYRKWMEERKKKEKEGE